MQYEFFFTWLDKLYARKKSGKIGDTHEKVVGKMRLQCPTYYSN